MKKQILPALLGLSAILLATGCDTPFTVHDSPEMVTWTSSQPAAPTSIEGRLRARGKTWDQTKGGITAGSYVADTLEGRLNQPEGRGGVGKVMSVAKDDHGQMDAMVDFGRGYRVGIPESELALIVFK